MYDLPNEMIDIIMSYTNTRTWGRLRQMAKFFTQISSLKECSERVEKIDSNCKERKFIAAISLKLPQLVDKYANEMGENSIGQAMLYASNIGSRIMVQQILKYADDDQIHYYIMNGGRYSHILNREQTRAVKTICEGQNIFLTGVAGSGKSMVIKVVRAGNAKIKGERVVAFQPSQECQAR